MSGTHEPAVGAETRIPVRLGSITSRQIPPEQRIRLVRRLRWKAMAPTRTRTRHAADVWLDDNLWAEPDRSREIELDAPPAPADAPDHAVREDDGSVGVPAFYDHEV